MSSEQLIEVAEMRVAALKEAIRQLEGRLAEIERAEVDAYGPKLRKMYKSLQANLIPPEMHRDLVVEFFRALLRAK